MIAAAVQERNHSVVQGFWLQTPLPGTPLDNMDTDTRLFEAVRDGAILSPIVRVYTWDRPSVSFGRLQNEAQVRAEFPGLPLVRRPTGGLAVRHGDDLTITVITRTEWLPPGARQGVLASYRQIMDGLLQALGALGVAAQLGGSACARQRGSVDCFASVADCDATEIVTGRKLVGSAQRRDRGAVLQQMSIPLADLPKAGLLAQHARQGLGQALGVAEWLFVDSLPAV